MTDNIETTRTEKQQSFINTSHTHGLPDFKDDIISSDDLEKINRIAPKDLHLDQIYVRSMYLCSTQLCESDYCCFTNQALEDIQKKIIGQSVLIGHNRNSLPLARFFKAEVVERDHEQRAEPVHFVRAWFYWLRETSGAKDLLLNIDGGVYREVSLAWRFHNWRCSVCNKENGNCSHKPGETYDKHTCYRIIDQVSDVLEGSLVYKSADKDTVLSGARAIASEQSDTPVVLLSVPDDPVMQYIEDHQLYSERFEITEWLHDGIDQIWYRSTLFEQEEELLKPYLCKGGVSVVEHYFDSDQPELAFGTLHTIQ